jgi:hypothetical protein
MRDAAAYARCVRRKVGLSQDAFARRMFDTAHTWRLTRRRRRPRA